MPSTAFAWGSEHTPVFQVYGTKRKSRPEEYTQSFPMQEEEMEISSKRRCVWPAEQAAISEVNHNHLPTEHITLVQHEQNQMQFQSSCPTQWPPHVENSPGNPPWQPTFLSKPQDVAQSMSDAQQPINATQNNYIMDLNDEVYSSAVDIEIEEACVNMDSDFAPDPAQYRRPAADCPDFLCEGGDRSPTSGRVRCFCKPSWEGMLDMRPYVSDIY